MAGSIIRRGERTFLVRVYMGSDPETGKQKFHHKTIHGRKKDAQAYLNKVLREKDLGIFVEPARMSLNQYLDRWLTTAARPRLRPSTFQSYEYVLRQYIRPTLGSRPLDKITPLDIQALYTALGKRGLSSRTIRYSHTVLRNAMSQAVRWRLLAHNPATDVDLPKQRREEMRPLSPTEARRFLEAAAEDSLGILFELLLTTGLRPGEALGLTWPDVDLEAGRLHVQRSLSKDAKGGDWRLQPPKTPRARRTVPLLPSTVQALRRHRRHQAEERLKAGTAWRDSDLVFTGRNGAPLEYRNLVKRHFKRVLEKAGLPNNIRLYDLRHTCATLLLAAGENPKIVSERLGHASIAMTLDVYSHVLPDMQESAVAKLNGLLYGFAGKK